MDKVFIYGSLRRGHFNYERWNFDRETTFIKEGVLSGYRMYDLGDFPCIVQTGDPKDLVVGEIFKYKDRSFKERIRAFEQGYGYEEVEVQMDGMLVGTFVFPKVPDDARLVTSGDWNNR